MNVDKTAYLIFDPWQVQPPPYESDYVNNVNDYMGNKIVEYLQDVPQHNKFVCMFTSMAETYGVHKGMKKYDFLRHQDVPDRMVKGNFDNLIYCGFHHGRCTLDTKDSGAKFMSQHKRKWNIYFKKELLCLLPGDSWIDMDNKSKQYGELI
tara:strand:+ start:183 stop:635 length:453 start_codon:yes stop_codon:yes gene_type:complete